MAMDNRIDNRENIIDSRDVIARIKALEEQFLSIKSAVETQGWCIYRTGHDKSDRWNAAVENDIWPGAAHHVCDYDVEAIAFAAQQCGIEVDVEEVSEIIKLHNFAEEGEGVPDWEDGVILIRDDYFQTYAQELADEIGAINRAATWPNNCIDWERAARELQVDYTALDFDGETYWARS
jgi:hypothetical protein